MTDRLERELIELEEELANVSSREEIYLPDYGYSSKDEIIELINEDIAHVKDEIEKLSFGDYTESEQEEERSFICRLQGLSRFC